MVTDEELLKQMQLGQEEAFSELYRRKHQEILRFALHMTGSRHGAEEVTQEVFLALIQRPENYDRTRGPLSAYLYGVARNSVLRWLKENRPVFAEETQEDIAGKDNPFLDASRTEAIRKLRTVILALPETYREVLVLCELQELSYEEAAAILECPTGTVRSRLHRARSLLADRLHPEKQSGSKNKQGGSAYELRAL